MKRVLVIVACLAMTGLQAKSAIASPGIPAQQQLVTVFTDHSVRAAPSADTQRLALLEDRRPITGERTVLPVLSQRLDRSGRLWLLVRLPGRAFGSPPPPPTGWISASNTILSTTPWHIVVDLDARVVTVYNHGRPLIRYPAIVGKPSTPTPPGQYFVEEDVTLSDGQPGGPFALATSDRSNVFQDFDGGPGQIAIHGIENLGGQLGTAESHGCIRLADNAITWLAARIAPGTPITISQGGPA
jgi:lipoprotein-anchoring transpeptidase ErfK/SrfK